MVRLDKFLCDCSFGTRSQVKELIRRGQVSVNGAVIKAADAKVDENTDRVICQGIAVCYQKYVYYILNKPRGVVSATQDNTADTVLSLLKGVERKELFPVGRLDKDTTGLLLITDDGELAHKLLSPKSHVDKTYLVNTKLPVTQEDIKALEEGVDIGDDKPTLPARCRIVTDNRLELTIHEGRFHQVKRMLQAIGNEVVALKRIRFGPISLPDDLPEGSYRALEAYEYEELKNGSQNA